VELDADVMISSIFGGVKKLFLYLLTLSFTNLETTLSSILLTCSSSTFVYLTSLDRIYYGADFLIIIFPGFNLSF
jgi:hypothetical protein